jgi:hypothetical protein
MKKIFFKLLTLALIASCASNEQKPVEKTYSADTNRAFEMIERGYLKKAPISAPAPQIESPVRKAPKKIIPAPEPTESSDEIFTIDEKINYNEEKLPAEHSKKPVDRVIDSPAPKKVDERLVEINQNLAFYCMKHRKDPAYGGDEAKCLKFVTKVQKSCQNQHRIVNSKLLNCIRSGLKKQK